ncbi:MAG: hypothetical protein QXD10_01105 [Metallosphaera sp.]|uniref:hypothetical protein n=1 Tax=Sulfolobaceae TaxID=118883 RepID=UPI00315F2F38
MGRNYFLDKDAVIDKEDRIGFILTNENPPGYLFGYYKYIYTGEGMWKGYTRILKYYGVHNLMTSPQTFLIEPCYGVEFPVIYRSRIKSHLIPEEGLRKLLNNERKSIFTDTLFSLAGKISITRLGVTGSLLLGIEHKKSDLDLVIYGCKGAEDFLSEFNGFEKDLDWIRETSSNYSLELGSVNTLYDVRTRGVYRGIRYSFLFVDDKPAKYCEDVCKPLGVVDVIGEIKGDCRALFYPSVAELYSKEYYQIVSWEGIYSMVLYKGGRAKIRGLELECLNGKKILIGDRNVKGYIQLL